MAGEEGGLTIITICFGAHKCNPQLLAIVTASG